MEIPTRLPYLLARPLPLLLALLWACGAEAPDAAPVSEPLRASPPPALPAGASWRTVPGVVAADEAVFLDPGWVVLDGLEGRLHLLDSLARHVRTTGGRGDGPGELAAPRHLVRDSGGFAVVGSDGRLDRFGPSGRFLERLRLDLEGCPLADVREARRAGGDLFLALLCTEGTTRRVALLRAGPAGDTEPVSAAEARPWSPLLPYGPVLGTVGDRVAWGSGSGPCVVLLPAPGAEGPDTLCLPGPATPLSEELRREVAAAVEPRARRAGMRIELPEHLPWMDRILDAGDGGILVRRPVDGARWRLERPGDPGGLWPVPEGVDVHGGPGTLLLVHHGLDGVRLATLRVADLPLHPRILGRP